MNQDYHGRGRRFGHMRPAAPPTTREASGVPPGTPEPPPAPAPVQKPQEGRKHAQPRLPHQSTFHAIYDHATESWGGNLVIFLANDQVQTFYANARTVFTLLSKLDQKYRQWVEKNAGQENTAGGK